MKLIFLKIEDNSREKKEENKNQSKCELEEVWLFRILVTIFIIAGIQNVPSSLPPLIIAGLLSGFYYGKYNDVIWNPSGNLEPNPRYRGHQIWIHILCGAIGGITLWMLLCRVYFWYPELSYLDGIDIFLFITSVLSFAGLLPRTLWFFANRGGNFESKV